MYEFLALLAEGIDRYDSRMVDLRALRWAVIRGDIYHGVKVETWTGWYPEHDADWEATNFGLVAS